MIMDAPPLESKISCPYLRDDIVSRNHLFKILDKGSNHKVTLISASAGYGKTTLIGDWLMKQSINGHWLFLEEEDNDPLIFMRYLIWAFQYQTNFDSVIGDNAENILRSSNLSSPESVISSLIFDINFSEIPQYIIFENFQFIYNPLIHKAISFLIEHQPSNLKIVIVSRTKPPLPFAKLRANGHLTVLDNDDLRFSEDETDALLIQNGIVLSKKDRKELLSQTEGWITALQLIAANIKNGVDVSRILGKFNFKDNMILDYLLEEVLHLQNDEIIYFLLHTSPLHIFNASLCDFVLDDYKKIPNKSSELFLKKLDESNIFLVPVDSGKKWFRYHHLFQCFLENQFLEAYPDESEKVLIKASEWFLKNGYIKEAVEYSIKCKQFHSAAQLIEENFGNSLIRKFENEAKQHLSYWISVIPDSIISDFPHFSLLSAWIHIANGNNIKALDDINRLEENHRDKDWLPGQIATVKAIIHSYSAEPIEIIKSAETALTLLCDDDHYWRCTAQLILADSYFEVGQTEKSKILRSEIIKNSKATDDNFMFILISLCQIETYRIQGDLQRVLDMCRQIEINIDESGMYNSPLAAWFMALWGEALFENNQTDKGIELVRKSIDVIQPSNDRFLFLKCNMSLLRVLFSMGLITELLEIVHKIELNSFNMDIPRWAERQMLIWKSKSYIRQRRLGLAEQIVSAYVMESGKKFTYYSECECLVLARVLLKKEQFSEVIPLLQRILNSAIKEFRYTNIIEAQLLLSLSFLNSQDMVNARLYIKKILGNVRERGYFQIIVDEVPEIIPLLKYAQNNGIYREYVSRIVETIPLDKKSGEIITGKSKIPEPLSKREVEVLNLISRGLTNMEIAERMFLSIQTIKVHTRNIYGKLQAHHRTEAVAIAREYGILRHEL